MNLSRFILVVVAFVLILGAMAPAAEARNCNCTFCQPGNLLAPCYWPGYGNVYCVDYWEFQCSMPFAAATAEEAATETLVCSAADAEDKALPESADSDDVAEDQDAGDIETDLADD